MKLGNGLAKRSCKEGSKAENNNDDQSCTPHCADCTGIKENDCDSTQTKSLNAVTGQTPRLPSRRSVRRSRPVRRCTNNVRHQWFLRIEYGDCSQFSVGSAATFE